MSLSSCILCTYPGLVLFHELTEDCTQPGNGFDLSRPFHVWWMSFGMIGSGQRTGGGSTRSEVGFGAVGFGGSAASDGGNFASAVPLVAFPDSGHGTVCIVGAARGFQRSPYLPRPNQQRAVQKSLR